MKLYVSILFSLLLLCYSCETKDVASPIKIGEVDVELTVEGVPADKLDDVVVRATQTPIFAGFNEDITTALTRRNDNVFGGKVAVERLEEIGGVLFECDSVSFGFPVVFRQDSPVRICLTVDEELSPVKITSSNPADPSMEDWIRTNELLGRYFTCHYEIVPDSLYSSWEKVMAYHTDTLWTKTMEYTIEDGTIPRSVQPWFGNFLKNRFAAISVMPYVKKAERYNGLEVEEPPMEAYTFLDSLDYSSTLLKTHPICGLRPFLYNMLRFPGGGLEPIGETPVGQWRDSARARLSKAISSPSGLLLDLLSAMSYVAQIEEEGKPLTERQIENVKAGYDNDLSTIILERNNSVVKSLEAKNLHDMVDEDFDLMAYIGKEFAGRPVVVDIWNTWCGPCRAAMVRIEELRNSLDPGNIAFLYIADESSPLIQWQQTASEIDGTNIRINSKYGAAIFEKYNLDGFPSYIIFNAGHEMIYARTGYPGNEEFGRCLRKLD